LQEPYRSESKKLIESQLQHVDVFISVSEYYAEFMPGYLGIPRNKIHVVPLGINLDGYEKKEPSSDGTLKIGYFARIAPEKGLHVLADAYQRMRKSGSLTNARMEVRDIWRPNINVTCMISKVDSRIQDSRRVHLSRSARSPTKDLIFTDP
jgi:glycosyltransferase involved in cell wall biosynthesis